MKIDDLLAKDQTNFLLTRVEKRPFSRDEKSSLTKFYSICKIKMRKIFLFVFRRRRLRQSRRSFAEEDDNDKKFFM